LPLRRPQRRDLPKSSNAKMISERSGRGAPKASERASPYPCSVEESGQIASFRSPPIAEVVTSVTFAPMPPYVFLSFGTFWQDRWAESFPNFELQPPYHAGEESFERLQVRQPIEFGFQPTPPLPRVWVTSGAGTELMQVQSNWFAANWRRVHADEPGQYDRWPARRAAFVQRWGELSAWLSDHGHVPDTIQCEVTYINHIAPIDGLWTTHGEASKVVRTISSDIGTPGLMPEQAQFQLKQLIPDDDDLPPWRLHATLTPAFAGGSVDPRPILILELTARGAPGKGDRFLDTLDRARRVIVESFVNLTTPSAREAWGQE
jgi:uncharacterized protein (TIGR04255 family)